MAWRFGRFAGAEHSTRVDRENRTNREGRANRGDRADREDHSAREIHEDRAARESRPLHSSGRAARARRDARLARAVVRSGSRAKADALVRPYYDEIFRFAARQLPDRQDAFDVTQEIFMTALRGLPGFDEARASFRTWLYRIAANKVIDWCRSARPVEVSLDELALDVADVRDEFAALHEDAERAELSERAELLLRTCAPQAQRVVRLRVYADRTFPEIARVVQEPEPAVKARYYRTMRALRGQLERERVTCEHAERKHSERARPASDRSRCERAPCEEGLR